MKKTPLTNIPMNDPYDTRLLEPHSLVSYGSFTAVFLINSNKMFVCYCRYICIFHFYFTMQRRDAFTCVGYIIITLLQIVCRVCQ